jgi:hypothetical protein
MALSFLAELDAGQNGSDGYGHEADGLSGMHQWVDRIDAQLELADRFEIIDDDMVGIMPNQVSQAEFEQIATLYSDVRRGSTNLQIDDTGLGKEDAASFQAQAMSDIADMLTTESGRGLVDDLAYGTVDGRDETTLITKSANPQSAGTEPAFGEKWSESIDGTGVSTNVFYGGIDLDMADSHPDYATAPYRQSSSDTVLFHELSHALHMRNGELAGTVDPGGRSSTDKIGADQAMIPNDLGVAEEEYITVGLGGLGGSFTENAYREERSLVTGTHIPLRLDYNGPGLPAENPAP